jgi:hypothetical protein
VKQTAKRQVAIVFLKSRCKHDVSLSLLESLHSMWSSMFVDSQNKHWSIASYSLYLVGGDVAIRMTCIFRYLADYNLNQFQLSLDSFASKKPKFHGLKVMTKATMSQWCKCSMGKRTGMMCMKRAKCCSKEPLQGCLCLTTKIGFGCRW